MFSFKCEDARRRNVLNGNGGAHRRHCNTQEVGHDEQVLKSVLKLAADADDGKEVESSEDDVESVEPDVDEADGNDEAEHCVAGPPKVPKHWHTVLGSNIELPEKTKYYLGWKCSFRTVVAESITRDEVFVKLQRLRQNFQGSGIRLGFRHCVGRSAQTEGATAEKRKVVRAEQREKDLGKGVVDDVCVCVRQLFRENELI